MYIIKYILAPFVLVFDFVNVFFVPSCSIEIEIFQRFKYHLKKSKIMFHTNIIIIILWYFKNVLVRVRFSSTIRITVARWVA